MTSGIDRGKTAIERPDFSRPIRLALEHGLITDATTVFDYGCGRGGDLRRLRERGIACAGWDPEHLPSAERTAADVVNLGHVVNVIEHPGERQDALRGAWELARRVLVVAARLEVEASIPRSIAHQDGVVTRLGTFQKLYQQDELRSWIESTLGESAVPAGPGVFYVFRSSADRETFLLARYSQPRVALRIERADELFERHRTVLEPLLAFLADRGRPPDPSELSASAAIVEALGSLPRAMRLIRAAVGEAQWQEAETRRTDELLIYFALSRFNRRPRFSELPEAVQRDVRAFFTSYQAGCELADALLFSAGQRAEVDRKCRESKVGKETPSALYVHTGALPELSPVLRIYEGCARGYIGTVEEANLIKLHRHKPQISYLAYPDFDTNPHPTLRRSVKVELQALRVEIRDYTESENPPILHRKETFVAPSYPGREKFARLTEQEERFGLFEETERIGTLHGWREVLREKGVALRGHRVVRLRAPQSRNGAKK